MLVGFSLFVMAAAGTPNNEGYISHSSKEGRGSPSPGEEGGGGGGGGGNKKSVVHVVPARGKRGRRERPPRPNHFLSVRIDNAGIWQNVSQNLIPLKFPYIDLWYTRWYTTAR